MLKGRAIVGQSGGPTSVINSSLAGVVDACRDVDDVTGVLGMRWAIEGFMAGEVIDLGREGKPTIKALRRTPGSALGSSRHKLTDADMPVILDRLREYGIRTLFMIGGNDTMDTIRRVVEYAGAQGYELCGVGVPKTVDNDLYGTDHTPGYPSAARYVALSVQQAGALARDMQKVDQFVIYQSIGRDAGWLAAAAALAKRDPDDAPHLIYLPERVFDRERFLADVERAHKDFGYVSIVCGEGIKYADGTPVSASRTRDKFANVEYGAMGGTSVALQLHRMISEAFGWRGEFQITESLCMPAIDRAVKLDLDEAYECGRAAVRLAAEGPGGAMVTLERQSSDPYRCTTGTAPLAEVAERAKPMPDEFINAAGNFTTEKFIEYARPLVGELPAFARLKCARPRRT
ncbi:MAG TPA: diphosphate--fructose-6-phosphate 1-phosphotransferase [Phycisphaerae bacterium]|nr:diphosphate--fructose-6-phosphate 1-phosphotransferase [Phycisphaerae bacterium]